MIWPAGEPRYRSRVALHVTPGWSRAGVAVRGTFCAFVERIAREKTVTAFVELDYKLSASGVGPHVCRLL